MTPSRVQQAAVAAIAVNIARRFDDFPISNDIPRPMPEMAIGPCEEWQGARTTGGYGQRKIKGKTHKVYRAAWINAHGPIPPGLDVSHLCDNPPCFRLSHLTLATHAENHERKSLLGRARGGRGGNHNSNGGSLDVAIIANIRRFDGSNSAAARALGVARETAAKYRAGAAAPRAATTAATG